MDDEASSFVYVGRLSLLGQTTTVPPRSNGPDMDNLMSHKLQEKKITGHTGNLWKVITRIFDLDALSIERIRVHSLAVNIIRPINWTKVIVYYILRVVCSFNLATIVNFKGIRLSFHRGDKLLDVLLDGSVWADNTLRRS